MISKIELNNEEILWQLEAEKAINQVLADDLKKLQARVKEYEYKFALIRSLASGKGDPEENQWNR